MIYVAASVAGLYFLLGPVWFVANWYPDWKLGRRLKRRYGVHGRREHGPEGLEGENGELAIGS